MFGRPQSVRRQRRDQCRAIFVMIGSGWKIYNDYAIFGWLRFPDDVVIGKWAQCALQWHFFGMWIFVSNGLCYLAYGIGTGRFRQKLFPISVHEIVTTVGDALRLRLRHDDLTRCNAVQKILYLARRGRRRGGQSIDRASPAPAPRAAQNSAPSAVARWRWRERFLGGRSVPRIALEQNLAVDTMGFRLEPALPGAAAHESKQHRRFWLNRAALARSRMIDRTRAPVPVSGACFAGSRSPWPPPLAAPTPLRSRPLCSSASQLLWRGQTSHDRASSATAPRLPDADHCSTRNVTFGRS